MAQTAAQQAAQPPVRVLAGSIAEAQALEIDYMQTLLAAKGAAPVPVEGAAGGTTHDHAAP